MGTYLGVLGNCMVPVKKWASARVVVQSMETRGKGAVGDTEQALKKHWISAGGVLPRV